MGQEGQVVEAILFLKVVVKEVMALVQEPVLGEQRLGAVQRLGVPMWDSLPTLEDSMLGAGEAVLACLLISF